MKQARQTAAYCAIHWTMTITAIMYRPQALSVTTMFTTMSRAALITKTQTPFLSLLLSVRVPQRSLFRTTQSSRVRKLQTAFTPLNAVKLTTSTPMRPSIRVMPPVWIFLRRTTRNTTVRPTTTSTLLISLTLLLTAQSTNSLTSTLQRRSALMKTTPIPTRYGYTARASRAKMLAVWHISTQTEYTITATHRPLLMLSCQIISTQLLM